MNRTTIALLVLTTVVSVRANLEWAYDGTLLDWDETVSAGWLVQMYHDVDADTDVSGIFQFDQDGTPFGTNVSDDVLLSSFTTNVVSGKNGVMNWLVSYGAVQWAELSEQNVYTVIFDAETILDANRAVVVDASSTTLPELVTQPAVIPREYYLTTVNNNWVDVIPEPTTMALLLTGIGGLFGLRRRMLK
jgi:hypothetical protein